MDATKHIKNLILFLIGISFLFSGCSIIGLGIGAAVDASKPKTVSIDPNEVNKIKNNSEITVHKKDGAHISGKFTGSSQLSPKEYVEEYKKFKKKNSIKSLEFFPDLGDSLTIIYKDTHIELHGFFIGFDHDKIWYSNNKGDAMFNVKYDTSYTSIKYKGYELDYIYIKKLINNGMVPTLLVINLLMSNSSTLNISAYDIEKILAQNKRKAKYIGLGVGLTIDAIISVLIISSGPLISFE